MTLASIGIGSNAARLLIRRIEADGRTRPASAKLLFLRYPLRLGDDVFVAGSISPARVKKMCRMIKVFRQLMRLYGVDSYRACATSTMREAANGREVARLIKRRTGVRIEIISGSTEASIVCDSRFGRAVASQPDVAMVDVGGGSTEVSLTLGGRKCLSVSFNVGTIRLLHQTDAQRAQALSSLASDLASRCVQLLPQGGVDIVGSGGNINKLRRLAGNDSKDDQPLTVADLERLLADLKPLTLRQRMERYGMKPDRADVIVPAAEIFLAIAEVLGAKRIAVPMLGLADGIIDDMYARHCAAARLGAGRRK